MYRIKRSKLDTVELDSVHYIVIGIGHNASGKMRANQNA